MKKLNALKGILLSLVIAPAVLVQAQPSVSAPTPPQRMPTKVVSIFSDAYVNIAGVNFNPGWGQSTVVETIQIGTDNVLKYATLNYQGTEFPDQNCASMTHLHIDVWADEDATVGLSPINHAPALGEQGEQVYAMGLKKGQWNSFDIPITTFDKMSFASIWQFKVDQGAGQTIYIDNLYFYNNSSVEDTAAPADFAASIGAITYNSIELLLTATDDSKAIVYDITYNDVVASTGGTSGVQRSYLVTGLESDKEYSFSISAKDPSGNIASNSPLTVQARTATAFAVPTVAAPAPTAIAADVISIFSNAYSPATTHAVGWWGQSTVLTYPTVGADEVMMLENFNYQGLELNGNVPAFDASAMTHFHIDVWTPNATKFEITPIGGGENLYSCEPLKLNEWNSFDLPISVFPNVNLTSIIQLKMVGSGTVPIVYLDNIYFYKNSSSSVSMESSNIRLFVEGSTLRFSADVAQSLEIISASGQSVFRSSELVTSFSYNLLPGVYIVRTHSATSKIVVR